MSGVASPGEHVRQEEWAERLGVSRFPVREALRDLAAEGLLIHDPNRGYFVAQMDVDEMSQLYLMRRLLEAELLRTARTPGRAELEELERAIQLVDEALERHNAHDVVLHERTFYFLLFDLSPLRSIAREARRLWALSEVYRASFFYGASSSADFRDYLADRHRRIIDAVRDGRNDQLVDLVMEGRLAMERRLTAYLRDRDAFFARWRPTD